MPMCYGNGAYVKVTCFFLAQFMNTYGGCCREIEFRWSEFNFTLSGYVDMSNGEYCREACIPMVGMQLRPTLVRLT